MKKNFICFIIDSGTSYVVKHLTFKNNKKIRTIRKLNTFELHAKITVTYTYTVFKNASKFGIRPKASSVLSLGLPQ